MPIKVTLKDGTDVIHSEVFTQAEVVIGVEKNAALKLDPAKYNFNLRIESNANGTVIKSKDIELRINQGNIISPSDSSPLRHGDVIRIGNTNCKLHFAYQSDADLPPIIDGTAITKTRGVLIPALVVMMAIVALVGLAIWQRPSTPTISLEGTLSLTVFDGATKIVDLQNELNTNNDQWELVELKPVGTVPSYVETSNNKLITLSPLEADTPALTDLVFKCTLRNSSSGSLYNHELTIRCRCLENANPPVVDLVTKYEYGIDSPEPIRIKINAIDPDSPPTKLRYQSIDELPVGSSIDEETGLFVWNVEPVMTEREYSIPIQVFKEKAPELRSTTILKVIFEGSDDVVNSSTLEDSIYYTYVFKEDPNNLFPIGMAVVVGEESLLTNAVNANELAQKIKNGWQAIVAPAAGDLTKGRYEVADILIHDNFKKSVERFGSTAYENTFFDLGIIKAHLGSQSTINVVESRSLEELKELKGSLSLYQSNIAEALVDPEVTSMLLKDSISINNIDIQPKEENVQQYAVIEFSSFSPNYLDGSLLFSGDKLMGIYSFTSNTDDVSSTARHFGCFPVHLFLLETENESSVWSSLLASPIGEAEE